MSYNSAIVMNEIIIFRKTDETGDHFMWNKLGSERQIPCVFSPICRFYLSVYIHISIYEIDIDIDGRLC